MMPDAFLMNVSSRSHVQKPRDLPKGVLAEIEKKMWLVALFAAKDSQKHSANGHLSAPNILLPVNIYMD